MANGFIFNGSKKLFDFFQKLNILELIKFLGRKKVKIKEKSIANWVDFFTLTKFALIIILWGFSINNVVAAIFVWYLIISNLYTFIYYLIWKKNGVNQPNIERLQRRFLKVILAIFFSDLCFAYLYDCIYFFDMDWSNSKSNPLSALWFSISNSVAGNYDQVKPLSNVGYNVSMIQFTLTFIFIAVILNRAIPQTEKG